MKTVAVIISAFKIDKYFFKMIKEFNNQKLPDGWKLKVFIGVDGCISTKKLLDLNNINYFYSKNNVGTYIISNSLIYEAQKQEFDVLVRFDSDDMPQKNFLYNGLKYVSKYGYVRAACLKVDEKFLPITKKLDFAQGVFFIKNETLELVGGFNEYRVEGDTDLMERLNILGNHGVVLDRLYQRIYAFGLKESFTNRKAIYHRRIMPNTLTSSKSTGHGSDYRNSVREKLLTARNNGVIKIINPTKVSLDYIDNKV